MAARARLPFLNPNNPVDTRPKEYRQGLGTQLLPQFQEHPSNYAVMQSELGAFSSLSTPARLLHRKELTIH